MAGRPQRRATVQPRLRLKPGEREARIVAEAAAFFAEKGFSGSTRALAARLGVTQALLYRYFRSKQALIDRVFQSRVAENWKPEWDRLIGDRSRPLQERLTCFYQAYRARSTLTGARLWMRANLDGINFAGRYSGMLTQRILQPIAAELRLEAGLPDFSARPFMRDERELVMTFHGSIAFLGIRKFIYRMPMLDDLDELVALQIRVALPGAVAEMRRLHGPEAEPALTVQVVDSPRRR